MQPVAPPLPRNEAAWAWWESMGSPRFVMAPMVDGSELPFRQLCRQYGVQLCYSPMVQASILRAYYKAHKSYDLVFHTEPTDRPLVFQISGNKPAVVLEAARVVQDVVDAIDLNLGCPQNIARRAGYGAYLMQHPDTVAAIVRTLSEGLRVPVCCKIRRLDTVAETVAFAQMLQRNGCSVLTVHGRTRAQRGQHVGHAQWAHIAAVKRAVGIPVILNGNVRSRADAERAMRDTGCDAVMSAWALLCNHRLFAAPAIAMRLGGNQQCAEGNMCDGGHSDARDDSGEQCAEGRVCNCEYGHAGRDRRHDERAGEDDDAEDDDEVLVLGRDAAEETAVRALLRDYAPPPPPRPLAPSGLATAAARAQNKSGAIKHESAFHAGGGALLQAELAEEYVAVARRYEGRDASLKRARLHLCKTLAGAFDTWPRLRELLCCAKTWERVERVVAAVRARLLGEPHCGLTDDEDALGPTLPPPEARDRAEREAEEREAVAAAEAEEEAACMLDLEM